MELREDGGERNGDDEKRVHCRRYNLRQREEGSRLPLRTKRHSHLHLLRDNRVGARGRGRFLLDLHLRQRHRIHIAVQRPHRGHVVARLHGIRIGKPRAQSNVLDRSSLDELHLGMRQRRRLRAEQSHEEVTEEEWLPAAGRAVFARVDSGLQRVPVDERAARRRGNGATERRHLHARLVGVFADGVLRGVGGGRNRPLRERLRTRGHRTALPLPRRSTALRARSVRERPRLQRVRARVPVDEERVDDPGGLVDAADEEAREVVSGKVLARLLRVAGSRAVVKVAGNRAMLRDVALLVPPDVLEDAAEDAVVERGVHDVDVQQRVALDLVHQDEASLLGADDDQSSHRHVLDRLTAVAAETLAAVLQRQTVAQTAAGRQRTEVQTAHGAARVIAVAGRLQRLGGGVERQQEGRRLEDANGVVNVERPCGGQIGGIPALDDAAGTGDEHRVVLRVGRRRQTEHA